MHLRSRQAFARAGSAALAVTATVVLAACGSSSGGGSGDTGAAGTGGATTGSATGGSAKTATLRIAYNPNPTNTTIVVADEQGFFTKNGLDVKLTASQASAALLPSVGKQFDLITATSPTILQSAAHGYKAMLVASQDIENATNLRNSYLIAAKNIKSLAALKGKAIGVPTLSGNLYEGAVIMLHKAGIEKNQVKFLQVPFANMANNLASGTIQAATTIVPFQGQLLGQGFTDLGNPVMEAVDSETALSAGWAGYQPWVATHKSVIESFYKAQEEALAWMKANPDGAKAVLVKSFHLPAVVAKNFPVTQFVSFETKDSYVSDWVAPMKAVGSLPSGFNTPMSQLVYTR